MMNRSQRIEYEILDWAINAHSNVGFPTTVAAFTARLRNLFSDVKPEEFIEACRRLSRAGDLEFRTKVGPISLPLDGSPADLAGSLTGNFFLMRTGSSLARFQALGRHVEIPTFKRWRSFGQ